MLNLTSLQVGKIFFNECFVVLMSQERMMKVFTQLKLAESVHSYRLWVNQFILYFQKNSKDTLQSVINEHARLAFLEKFSTILSIFHVINTKFHHARLFIYLVNKQLGWHFFSSILFYSGLLVYQGLQSTNVCF